MHKTDLPENFLLPYGTLISSIFHRLEKNALVGIQNVITAHRQPCADFMKFSLLISKDVEIYKHFTIVSNVHYLF